VFVAWSSAADKRREIAYIIYSDYIFDATRSIALSDYFSRRGVLRLRTVLTPSHLVPVESHYREVSLSERIVAMAATRLSASSVCPSR
jgi:hypothetical protein